MLLDTNVLSELMRSRPHPHVLRWVDSIPRSALWTTAIAVMEIRFGIELVRDPARRIALEDAFAERVAKDFGDRVAAFDAQSAGIAARFKALARARGVDHGLEDIQIAATAYRSDFTLVTRNTRDFEFLPIRLLNPWITDPAG